MHDLSVIDKLSQPDTGSMSKSRSRGSQPAIHPSSNGGMDNPRAPSIPGATYGWMDHSPCYAEYIVGAVDKLPAGQDASVAKLRVQIGTRNEKKIRKMKPRVKTMKSERARIRPLAASIAMPRDSGNDAEVAGPYSPP